MWPLGIDRTLVGNAERARLARENPVAADFYLQPAIAARGAGPAGSGRAATHHLLPHVTVNCSLRRRKLGELREFLLELGT
jgi:hypothetical protein